MWWDQAQGGQRVQFGIWAPEAVSCRALPSRGSSSPHLCYGRQLPLLLTDEKTRAGAGGRGRVMQCFIPLLAMWTGTRQSWPQVLPLPLLSLSPPFLSLLCPTEGVTAPPC